MGSWEVEGMGKRQEPKLKAESSKGEAMGELGIADCGQEKECGKED
jgi:hypothetical protein